MGRHLYLRADLFFTRKIFFPRRKTFLVNPRRHPRKNGNSRKISLPQGFRKNTAKKICPPKENFFFEMRKIGLLPPKNSWEPNFGKKFKPKFSSPNFTPREPPRFFPFKS